MGARLKAYQKARMVNMIGTSTLESDMIDALEREPMSLKRLAYMLDEDLDDVRKTCDVLKSRDAVVFCTNTGTYKVSTTKHNSLILAKPWGANRTMRIKTYY